MQMPVIEVIEDEMVVVLKKKTPQERLKIAFSLLTSTKKRFPYFILLYVQTCFVPGDGIEPPTQGFSVPCSTD